MKKEKQKKPEFKAEHVSVGLDDSICGCGNCRDMLEAAAKQAIRMLNTDCPMWQLTVMEASVRIYREMLRPGMVVRANGDEKLADYALGKLKDAMRLQAKEAIKQNKDFINEVIMKDMPNEN